MLLSLALFRHLFTQGEACLLTCFSVKESEVENITTVLCMEFSSSSLTTYGESIKVTWNRSHDTCLHIITGSKGQMWSTQYQGFYQKPFKKDQNMARWWSWYFWLSTIYLHLSFICMLSRTVYPQLPHNSMLQCCIIYSTFTHLTDTYPVYLHVWLTGLLAL